MYRRTPIIYRIADSFFRHQLLFWSALLIVSGLTMAALYARSKTFHATAMTQVQPESVVTVLNPGDSSPWITPAQKNADRFLELIKQDQPGGFLDTALQNAHLTTPIYTDPQLDDPRYATLEKNLTATPESANVFSINLTWDNAVETASIVRALQKQYISEVGNDRAITSVEGVHFLDSQLAEVRGKMRQAEKALADFKSSYNGQLSDADSTVNNQLSSLQAELDEKQVTFGENGRRKTVLAAELASMPQMSTIEQQISNQSPLEKQVAELLAKRDGFLAQGETPQHPDVVALDARIKQLLREQRANANAPENQRNTQTKQAENPQYQTLKIQVAEASIAQEADQQEMQNLRQQIGKYQSLVSRIPAAQRELADKLRDYQYLQERYNDFQKRRGDLQTQAALDHVSISSSITAITQPYALPTTGRTKLIAMLLGSIFLGCLVGAILIVLSEWSDHSLRDESDAERLLGVPVLAALPETAALRINLSRRALTGGAAALPESAPEGSN